MACSNDKWCEKIPDFQARRSSAIGSKTVLSPEINMLIFTWIFSLKSRYDLIHYSPTKTLLESEGGQHCKAVRRK